jgi:hypothetical protein
VKKQAGLAEQPLENSFPFALCFILGITLFLAACGRTGDPKPRETSRSFAWEELAAGPLSGCLDLRGRLSGAYKNLDALLLEFSDTTAGLDCPACPFLTADQVAVRNLPEVVDARGELRLTYCPALPAPAYRLRLVGLNVFDPAARHAVSEEIFVLMP